MTEKNLKAEQETATGPTRRGFLLGSLASIAGASLTGCASLGNTAPARAERRPITDAAWGPEAGHFPLKVGVGKVNINPPRPIEIMGFIIRKKGKNTGFYSDLFVKVLVLDDNVTKSVFITGDLCFWANSMVDDIRKHLAEKYKLTPAQIIINASHTHEGPSLNVDKEYNAELLSKTYALVDECMANMKPARVFFGRGKCDIGINRRLPDRFGYVNMELNKYGPTDPELLVLKFIGHDGKPMAILTNFACHLTTSATFLMGSDYAGVGNEMLEKEIPGAIGLFLQGCAGDVKPNLPQKDDPFQFDRHPDDGPEAVRKLAIRFKTAIKEVLSRPMEEITGPVECKMEVVEMPLMSKHLEAVGEPPFDGPTRKWVRMAKLILDSIDENGNYKKSQKCEIHVIRIGPETGATTGSKFVLVGLSGEMAVPFALRIKAQLRHNEVMVAAYNGANIGYVLGSGELTGMGYESKTAYSPDHEDVVCCKVMDMVLGVPPEL